MYECDYHYDGTASTTAGTLASSTCSISTTTPPTIATTSDIVILPTITAGEVLISFLLFCLIVVVLTKYMISALNRVKTRKQYLGYAGGDVEMRDDI